MRIVLVLWISFFIALVTVVGYGIIYPQSRCKKDREKREKEIEKWKENRQLITNNNKDFLITFYKDQQDEMRWRGNPEYHILLGSLVGFPFVVNAAMSFCKASPDMAPSLSIGFIVFIGVLYFLLFQHISANHKLYEIISRNVVRIWIAFGMFEGPDNSILAEGDKYYGTGKGHLRTMNIISFLAICSLTILLLLGIKAIKV